MTTWHTPSHLPQDYKKANLAFAEMTIRALELMYEERGNELAEADEAPLVWIHDYHLMLAANTIRQVRRSSGWEVTVCWEESRRFFLEAMMWQENILCLYGWWYLFLNGKRRPCNGIENKRKNFKLRGSSLINSKFSIPHAWPDIFKIHWLRRIVTNEQGRNRKDALQGAKLVKSLEFGKKWMRAKSLEELKKVEFAQI